MAARDAATRRGAMPSFPGSPGAPPGARRACAAPARRSRAAREVRPERLDRACAGIRRAGPSAAGAHRARRRGRPRRSLGVERGSPKRISVLRPLNTMDIRRRNGPTSAQFSDSMRPQPGSFPLRRAAPVDRDRHDVELKRLDPSPAAATARASSGGGAGRPAAQRARAALECHHGPAAAEARVAASACGTPQPAVHAGASSASRSDTLRSSSTYSIGRARPAAAQSASSGTTVGRTNTRMSPRSTTSGCGASCVRSVLGRLVFPSTPLVFIPALV